MDLKARIMVAIGAGSLVAACGGETEDASKKTADAATDSPAADAADDGGDAASDAIADTGPDVLDAAPDADAQACVDMGQPCTPTDSCCSPSVCTNGTCIPSVRRPFLIGSSLRVADATERDDWLAEHAPFADHGLDRETTRALAQDWLNDGCEEYASIAAFARFSMHLASVGAPPEMILASQRAAMDEVRHAQACFALARRYGGKAMGPANLSLDGAITPMTLAEIAALTAEEGCVGETLGVLLAQEQLARTTDPVARALLVNAGIVADEARHAELAWSFVRWAIDRGGDPVREAVAAAIRRALDATLAMPIRKYDGIDLAAWAAHGRFTCEDAHQVAVRGARDVVEPCAALLLATQSPRTDVGQRAHGS
jgi:hypothetical protein